MSTKTIILTTPIELHGKRISEVKVKEPTGGQFLDFGEPFVGSRTSDGNAFFSVEDSAVIRRYLDEAIDHENGGDILRLMTLTDTRAVKSALLSFFYGAPQSTET